jgi:pimeloyl-ACP methyl ester carboxylesterase
MRWLKRIALGLVVLYALLVLWAPYWLVGRFTTRRYSFPDRENAGLTPQSFGLAFEAIGFRTADGVDLKGWWVPASPAHGTVVLVHGLNRSRLEMVKKVPFLHTQGWNALLFDERHHGESGGEVSTLGWHEREDVKAAKAFARGRDPGPVVYWGVSLGAAAATLAAAEDPDVAGLVCDSTYRSLPDTVRHHLRLVRGFRWWLRIVPSWPMSDEILFWIGRKGGFDPKAVDVRAAASRLAGRPCLFVCNSGDQRMPSEIAFELKAAAGDRARVLVVPGKSHGGAWREGTAAYESAVTALLAEAQGQGAGASASLASAKPVAGGSEGRLP